MKHDHNWHVLPVGDTQTHVEKGMDAGSITPQEMSMGRSLKEQKEIGLTDCGCNAGFKGGVVLDPFAGAFTTCVVAKRLGRKFIGIELNPDYIKLAEKRLLEVPESLFT